MPTTRQLSIRRAQRVRSKIARRKSDRLRLSVFRSGRHIYAQVIDDQKGMTVIAASTLEKTVREQIRNGATADAASEVGKRLAERAKSAGIENVTFDRGGYRYHGRIKALADAARDGGLNF